MKTIKKSLLLSQLGGPTKVQNLQSARTYREVPNQFDINCKNGSAFQSYNSLIAVRMGGKLYLTEDHDYSNTTSKYATEWTGYTTQERRQGLKDGRFILITD